MRKFKVFLISIIFTLNLSTNSISQNTPGSFADLAEKLISLIENPEKRDQLGIQARKQVKNFSPENVMPVWENIINN